MHAQIPLPMEVEAMVHAVVDQESIVALTDRMGTIVYANDRFCEISGYRRDELLGQNHRLLKSGVHSVQFYKGLWATILSGRVWRGEICNRAKDGHLYWVETVISPLRQQGLITHFIALRTDITEWKAAQEALVDRQKREEEERRMAALGRMADGVLHDLSNVLTGVIGLAAEMGTDERGAMLQDAVGRMVQLTRTLREYSSGRPSAVETFRLNPLINCACALLRYRKGLPAALDFSCQIEATANCQITGNEGQIFEVVLNLVVNAAEAVVDASSPEIRVHTAMVGGKAVITVEDSGRGVAAATVPSLFEPYSSTKGPGRGLGLSVARRIALAHGGDLRLDRAGGDGTGARFCLEVPVSATEREASEVTTGAAARRVILVVEDDLKVRRLIERAAGRSGSTAIFPGDTTDLLALANKVRDVLSAAMIDSCEIDAEDGAVACLRRIAPQLPILLISGRLNGHGWRETPWGAVWQLPKPFSTEQLEDILRAIVAARK